MSGKTIEIGGRTIELRLLRMRHLRKLYSLPDDAVLESMLVVLEGATNLKPEDLDDMDGLELKKLADAIKEENAPFLEMLNVMEATSLSKALEKVIDSIFFAPFLPLSAQATAPPSGDTPIASS